MAVISPYIHFNGNAEEAFEFYKSVFGGEFSKVMRYKELSSLGYPVGENNENRIMHIALPIGKASMLMGSDVLEIMGQVTETDNRNSISVSAGTREEADRLYVGLSKGGKVEMPIADGPLGSYFGMLADKYGIQWMVDFTPNSEP